MALNVSKFSKTSAYMLPQSSDTQKEYVEQTLGVKKWEDNQKQHIQEGRCNQVASDALNHVQGIIFKESLYKHVIQPNTVGATYSKQLNCTYIFSMRLFYMRMSYITRKF